MATTYVNFNLKKQLFVLLLRSQLNAPTESWAYLWVKTSPYLTVHWGWSLWAPPPSSQLTLAQYSKQYNTAPSTSGRESFRWGIVLSQCFGAKHCTCNPNNTVGYSLMGNRYQKMTCKGERPCRPLPPNQGCLADQGSPRKLDKGYDFFPQKMKERIKSMHQDAFNTSLIAERMRTETGKLREKASARFIIMWRKKSTLVGDCQKRGSSNFGGREKELQCLSTLLTFVSEGPLLSSSSTTSTKHSGPSTLYCQSTPAASGPASHVGFFHTFSSLSLMKRVDSD